MPSARRRLETLRDQGRAPVRTTPLQPDMPHYQFATHCVSQAAIPNTYPPEHVVWVPHAPNTRTRMSAIEIAESIPGAVEFPAFAAWKLTAVPVTGPPPSVQVSEGVLSAAALRCHRGPLFVNEDGVCVSEDTAGAVRADAWKTTNSCSMTM